MTSSSASGSSATAGAGGGAISGNGNGNISNGNGHLHHHDDGETVNGNGAGPSNGDETLHADVKTAKDRNLSSDVTLSDIMDEDPNHFTPLYDGSNLDRRQFIRITLQSLRELGYESSARSLEAESGITLEHPSIVAFRKSILSGDWRNAEESLLDGLKNSARSIANQVHSSGGESSASPNLNLVFRDPKTQGLDSIKFLIYQQRYLELLEAKQTRKALAVLRDRLAPLNYGSNRLHLLSSLVICATTDELRARAHWPGAGQESRRKVLVDIEATILPSVMIPSRRLPQLIEQAQHLQKVRDPFYNLPLNTRISLYVDHRPDKGVFPTRNLATMKDHQDEIWHVAFSNDGSRLASAGKNKHITVWNVGSRQDDYRVLHTFGPLSSSVCHVAFSPNDKRILCTTDNGDVVVWDLANGERQDFKGHSYTVGSASWYNNGRNVVSGGMDGKVIFWNAADGKMKDCWNTFPFRVQSLDVSPDGRYLVAISHRYLPTPRPGSNTGLASAHLPSTSTMHTWADANTSPVLHDEEWAFARSETDDFVDLGGGSRTLRDERFQIHFYDLRRQEELGSVYMKDEMTSVCFSEDSRHVLINQRPNEAQLWDVVRQSLTQRFSGHHIHNFVVRSCFGGAEESFVVSGSEDGAVYLYHRKTGRLLERLRAHEKGSVNSVAWHPRMHNMFASCGDDGTIRIWGPGVDETLGRGFGEMDYLRMQDREGAQIQNGSQGISSEILAQAENGYELLSGAPIIATSSAAVRSGDPAAYAHTLSHSQDLSDGAGPTPFPWATSPRSPASPTSTSVRRRRQAALNAQILASSMPRRRHGTTEADVLDEDDEEAGHAYEDDEEDEDEEEEEEEEEEEDAMEEGGD